MCHGVFRRFRSAALPLVLAVLTAAALATAAQKLGEAMYAEQQAAAGEAAGSAAPGGRKDDDGDVVDAEFTEVKDKK